MVNNMDKKVRTPFDKNVKGYYTDIVWKKLKGQWYKVWLNGKKIVRKEKFDQPYSD